MACWVCTPNFVDKLICSACCIDCFCWNCLLPLGRIPLLSFHPRRLLHTVELGWLTWLEYSQTVHLEISKLLRWILYYNLCHSLFTVHRVSSHHLQLVVGLCWTKAHHTDRKRPHQRYRQWLQPQHQLSRVQRLQRLQRLQILGPSGHSQPRVIILPPQHQWLLRCLHEFNWLTFGTFYLILMVRKFHLFLLSVIFACERHPHWAYILMPEFGWLQELWTLWTCI